MRPVSVILALIFFCAVSLMSCDSSSTDGGSKKDAIASDTPLIAPANSAARMDNDEGVGHYRQGHWDVAAEHFRKAVKADANSAVAHYNLGLAQDKLGKHDEAAASFKKALELAPNDSSIKDSEILKKHMSM